MAGRIHRVAPLPDEAAIEAIVDSAFWASLRQHEGYPLKVTLAYLAPGQTRAPLMFGQPLPLNADVVTRLAPAVERPGVHLGVWRQQWRVPHLGRYAPSARALFRARGDRAWSGGDQASAQAGVPEDCQRRRACRRPDQGAQSTSGRLDRYARDDGLAFPQLPVRKIDDEPPLQCGAIQRPNSALTNEKNRAPVRMIRGRKGMDRRAAGRLADLSSGNGAISKICAAFPSR